MSKTPEELAEEYAKDWHKDCDYPEEILKHTIKATKTTFLAGYKAAKDQLADTGKVMCSTTMEEIKAVDTGDLMPITNLPTSAKWISVKDRLPEDDREVLVVLNGESYKDVHVSWHDGEDFGWATTGYVSHWMPLPAPPKEEK